MKFTKEEISLCKQVAEKHRKEIDWGDIVYGKKGIGIVATISVSPHGKKTISIDCYQGNIPHYEEKEEGLIPLWTISDCLEFFKEREHGFERAYQLAGTFHVSFVSGKGTKKGSGDTLLIACLKAVLAVLEEGK